jgi:hypothetical protein
MLKRTRSLVCLCLAAAISSPTTYANSIDLPDIGTAAGGTLSIDQELIYGDAYMRMLRASKPIVNDPVINEYIDVAHAFFDEDEPKVVNGVLDRLAHRLRPAEFEGKRAQADKA